MQEQQHPTVDLTLLESSYLLGLLMSRVREGDPIARSAFDKLKANAIALGVEWCYGDPGTLPPLDVFKGDGQRDALRAMLLMALKLLSMATKEGGTVELEQMAVVARPLCEGLSANPDPLRGGVRTAVEWSAELFGQEVALAMWPTSPGRSVANPEGETP